MKLSSRLCLTHKRVTQKYRNSTLIKKKTKALGSDRIGIGRYSEFSGSDRIWKNGIVASLILPPGMQILLGDPPRNAIGIVLSSNWVGCVVKTWQYPLRYRTAWPEAVNRVHKHPRKVTVVNQVSGGLCSFLSLDSRLLQGQQDDHWVPTNNEFAAGQEVCAIR